MKFAGFAIGFVALAATAVGVAATSASAAPAGDPVKGKTVFARCAACHDLNTGKTLLGPSLKGIVGRKVGSVANFAYSPAVKTKGGTWTPQALDTFITAPMKAIPGTRMPFAGLPNPDDRANLIAYLTTAAK